MEKQWAGNLSVDGSEGHLSKAVSGGQMINIKIDLSTSLSSLYLKNPEDGKIHSAAAPWRESKCAREIQGTVQHRALLTG